MRNRMLALAVALAVMPVSAPGATWYVDQSGGGDAQSIQAALDICSAGDTVLVAPGTYSIDSPLYPNDCFSKPLYIIGEAGAAETIIDCAGSAHGFVLSGGIYIIRGFTVTGASASGIEVDLAFLGEIVVRNCVLKENAGSGIDIRQSSSTINILSNIIHSNGRGITSDESNGIYIIGNTISGHGGVDGAGISIVDCNPIPNIIQNNIIVDNTYMLYNTSLLMLFEYNDVYNNLHNQAAYVGIGGNFSLDPQFCSAVPRSDGNFFLQSDSPCAPGNHPLGLSCGLIGARGVDCGTTSAESSSWGRLKSLH
ncbi:MAG: right-handed parallel beta-helix repeat-containing protein [Candidatus Krumholzibacteria bacterium]|nr:right-handed parallel beta-helix repeat-containing protein [Candidatus Krumholzibacteria bacterium]